MRIPSRITRPVRSRRCRRADWGALEVRIPEPPDTHGRAHRPPEASTVGDRTPSPRTVRLYASDWHAFVAWCRDTDASPLPADPDTVAAYLSAYAGRLGPGALARRVSAIADRHRECGLPTPTSAPAVKILLAAARANATPRRAPPPSPKQLARLIAACPGDLAGTRDRALLLLMEVTELGRDALVGLDAEAIRIDRAGVSIGVDDQIARILVSRRAELGRCPVRALQDWLDASDTRFGPVFRKVDRWGNIAYGRLGADAIRRILARRTPLRLRHPRQRLPAEAETT